MRRNHTLRRRDARPGLVQVACLCFGLSGSPGAKVGDNPGSGAMSVPRTLGGARRFVVRRRTFLLTATASAGVLAARFALLPRGLSQQQIDRLAEAPAVPVPTRLLQATTPVAAPTVDPADPPLAVSTSAARSSLPAATPTPELDYDLSKSMVNPLAEQLELGPIIVKWKGLFKINTVERDPYSHLDRWSLGVDGLVSSKTTYDRSALNRLGRCKVQADFQCVEGWGVRGVVWEGVRLKDVLDRAGLTQNARGVTFHTVGGVYTESLSLEQAFQDDVLLADTMNGKPLPQNQGLPLRLVVPFMYGYKSAKWVNGIEATEKRHVGFWERRGWMLDPYV